MSWLPAPLRRIQWRLPLSVATLLLAVVAAFSWIAHREVREASVEAAEERLVDVARQLSGLLGRSVETRLAEVRRVAEDPAVVAALSPSGEVSRARPALSWLLGSDDQVRAVELWDVEDGLVLRVDGAGPDGPRSAREGRPPDWAAGNSPAVGPLRSADDSVWYEVAATVRSDGRALGTVLQRRRLSSSSRTSRVIADLIGMEARFLIGAGGTWTDLDGVVPGPPGPSVRASEEVVAYDAPGGRRRLGTGRPIPHTSWRVWVYFPEATVLARSRGFLGQILPIGIAVVLIGALLGWVLTRRVTGPLSGVAAAASAFAGGDYGRRVPTGGDDELGELAVAFNVMAQRVENSHQRLEQQVKERTAALERHANDLEVANRELEAFCYSVSHDLRAPLRAVHGFSRALLEDYEHALDDQGRDYLRRVCRAADRMGLLIDDLLHLSRVARADVSPEEVDLSRLAEEIVEDLRAEEPDRAVDATIEPGLRAVGDPNLLRIALTNLLGNAWKFTAGRDRARLEFGTREDGDVPVFFVRDNGAGFDMAHARKLFGPFQRLHRADEFPGTGIGLATVQRVVHRHGGAVWAEAGVDEGATFFFTLSGDGRAGQGGSEASPGDGGDDRARTEVGRGGPAWTDGEGRGSGRRAHA